MKITDEMVALVVPILEKDEGLRDPFDDVARRIISAVAPLIRSAALEEAAKVADQVANADKSSTHYIYYQTGAHIASSIRSLKDKPNE